MAEDNIRDISRRTLYRVRRLAYAGFYNQLVLHQWIGKFNILCLCEMVIHPDTQNNTCCHRYHMQEKSKYSCKKAPLHLMRLPRCPHQKEQG